MHVFTQKTSDRLGHLGEEALILAIKDWLGPVGADSPRGIGDDCAVLEPPVGKKQILTVDSLSYGRHFDERTDPRDAGSKLVKRNLSDIAAMGGSPGPALLALLCGPDVSIPWLAGFFEGVRASCEKYGVHIVGGDVSGLDAGQFSAVLSLAGSVTDPKLRDTARVGDAIYVTGELGGSIRNKHFAFEPRLAEGQWLAETKACSALMDLTDGLAKDLNALLPESSAAAIDLDTIPLADDARLCARDSGLDPLEHAFCDGEDYELLFTLGAQADCAAFESAWGQSFPLLRLTRIGRIRPQPAGKCQVDSKTNEILPWRRSFEHFKIG